MRVELIQLSSLLLDVIEVIVVVVVVETGVYTPEIGEERTRKHNRDMCCLAFSDVHTLESSFFHHGGCGDIY